MGTEKLEEQIAKEQSNVDYNTREFTIEILVSKYHKNESTDKNELYVPDYQRDFVWDIERQSRFVESIILGLPIPLIFVAENLDGRFEIVDGSQRIRTLSAFLHNDLKIDGLDILSELNGLKFHDLSEARIRKLNNTPIRMIVLAEKTTETVKNDIFDRINRGSDLLKEMEKRKGIYKGKFNDFIYKKCSTHEGFRKITRIGDFMIKRQEYEELILRFFALSDSYPGYSRKVGLAKYLDEYLASKNIEATDHDYEEKFNDFSNMVEFIQNYFPFGFSKSSANSVSRVYFEALAVGVHLALKSGDYIIKDKQKIKELVLNQEFLSSTSGKYNTHSAKSILQRIDYIKNGLLNLN